MAIEYEGFKDGGVKYFLLKLKDKLTTLLAGKVDTTKLATDSELGLVKTNTAESVGVNANGQITVGGRLGQFPGGGVFYPTTANPKNVGNYSFLITDALNMSANRREFIIAGGSGITLRNSHAAGSTEYRISNSYANRIACCAIKGGVATLTEATAPQYTVSVLSVKFANGNDISAYSGGTESNNDIIITTDGSANPDSATTSIRFYGVWTTTDIISAGQCNGAANGKTLQVGQYCRSESNQTLQVGNSVFSSGNNSGQIGRQLINKQTDSFLAGFGHDNSNGSQGSSAVGLWSSIESTTAFAVGNGTSATARSNAFEVTKDGGIVLKSPNGTRYKITVSNTGALTATAL